MARTASFRMPKNKCKQRVTTRKGTIVGMKKVKGTILVIACPRGKLDKEGSCKVGTFVVEKIKASRKGAACPTGYRKR